MSALEWVTGAAVTGVVGAAAWWLFIKGIRSGSTVASTWLYVMRYTKAFHRNGVRGVFFERADYVRYRKEKTVAEYMGAAHKNLKYVGYWLAEGFEIGGAREALVKLLERGVRVEFVLLSPKAPRAVLDGYARFFGTTTPALVSRIQGSLASLSMVHGSLAPDRQRLLSIRVHSEWLSCSCFILDADEDRLARLLIDTKFYGVERGRTLGIELKPSGNPDGLFERINESMQLVISVKHDSVAK